MVDMRICTYILAIKLSFFSQWVRPVVYKKCKLIHLYQYFVFLVGHISAPSAPIQYWVVLRSLLLDDSAESVLFQAVVVMRVSR